MKLIETFAEIFLCWEKDPCNLNFVYSGVLEEIAVSQIVFSLQSKVRSHGLNVYHQILPRPNDLSYFLPSRTDQFTGR